MRLVFVSCALSLCGCGSYEDFRLPVLERTPVQGHWSWEARKEPVLARGVKGEWDSADALNPSVVRRGSSYFNFYSGFDGKTWHTGAASSPDGIVWKKMGRTISPAGWEGTYWATNGAALVAGDEFLYWYQAGGLTPRIAFARSADGLEWKKHPTAVLGLGPRGSWDERGVADPYVVRYGSFFYMYYLGQDRARRQRLGVARSADGIHWTRLRSNPILELGEDGAFDENGLGEPAVWYSNGSYWMLYTGRDRAENRRMGIARSQDGVKWSKLAAPVISGSEPWNATVVCDPTVEVLPDGVRVWFGGGNRAHPVENIDGQIGLGTLHWQTVEGGR